MARDIATDDTEADEFKTWMAEGLSRGWIGPAVCSTHDGIPATLAEDTSFEEGEDPCIHILRLYADQETKKAVEENHSPSEWRKPND